MMHDLPDIPPELHDLLAGDNHDAFRQLIEHRHPHAVAQLIDQLDDDALWTGLQQVPATHRAEVFSHLDLDRQVRLIERHPTDGVAALVQDMAPDDCVDMVKRLGVIPRRRLLDRLDPPVRRDIERLALYAEDESERYRRLGRR